MEHPMAMGRTGEPQFLAAVHAGRRGEAWYRRVLDESPAAIYTTDAAGRITYYNRAAAVLAGRSPTLNSDEWCVSWRLYWPDGHPMAHDESPMARTLRERVACRGQDAVLERPDGTRIPFLPFPTPLYDADGTFVGALNVLVDITETKAAEGAVVASELRYRALSEELELRVLERTRELQEANARLVAEAQERERAEDALLHAQKLEAVGQLASGLAHDSNNLLAAILGNLALIEKAPLDEVARQRVKAAAAAALRGAQLNKQMLAFSRKQHLAPSAVDLNRLLGGMADLLRRTLGSTVQVVTSFDPALWPALVDPTQVELVVLNLAINARDAMPSGGVVRISSENVLAAHAPPDLELAPGEYVRLSVADEGTGMSDEVLARACEPFFTTKDIGKGSGLGLSQAYGFARQSGGGLHIESAVGKGTTVVLYLPRSPVAGAPERDRRPKTSATRRAASVLVVDDQDDVREVTMLHLEALGYRVAGARSGRAALERLQRGDVFDLLLVDQRMPEMSGAELARAARERWPNLPIVVVSGCTDASIVVRDLEGAAFLEKPYRADELLVAVESALRKTASRR
ncbi:MAG: response regulator [Pseudomonadota bacterium]|nr:response regulator [Pseudomonadota bacterium]